MIILQNFQENIKTLKDFERKTKMVAIKSKTGSAGIGTFLGHMWVMFFVATLGQWQVVTWHLCYCPSAVVEQMPAGKRRARLDWFCTVTAGFFVAIHGSNSLDLLALTFYQPSRAQTADLASLCLRHSFPHLCPGVTLLPCGLFRLCK